MSYYDGTKLLSLKDLSGERPEVYMAVGNRTGGKTTYFNRLLINRFIKKQSKFMLIYRFKYELKDCADKFFKDVGALFFPEHTFNSKSKSQGVYHELFLDGVPCGYAVSINSSDQIKKMSHLFSDVGTMLFDEFISEVNHYANDELNKLFSIHSSVARGHGAQYRYVPLYMCANNVTVLNPYYAALGISSRITADTHFLKGDGFVLEVAIVKSAAKAQMNSGFNKAFSGLAYANYSINGQALMDNLAFLEKPTGANKYIVTLKYKDNLYSVREYPEEGILYVDDSIDNTFPLRIAVTTNDHQVNYVMLKQNNLMVTVLRQFFETGYMRFKNLEAKEAMLTAISYF